MNAADPPKSLNATQMQKRRVAAIKARKRTPVDPSQPSGFGAPSSNTNGGFSGFGRSNSADLDSVPLFAPMPQEFNNGPVSLFGGSVQANPSFDFSVPQPKPDSFGSQGSSFGFPNGANPSNPSNNSSLGLLDIAQKVLAPVQNSPMSIFSAPPAVTALEKWEEHNRATADLSAFRTLQAAAPPDMSLFQGPATSNAAFQVGSTTSNAPAGQPAQPPASFSFSFSSTPVPAPPAAVETPVSTNPFQLNFSRPSSQNSQSESQAQASSQAPANLFGLPSAPSALEAKENVPPANTISLSTSNSVPSAQSLFTLSSAQPAEAPTPFAPFAPSSANANPFSALGENASTPLISDKENVAPPAPFSFALSNTTTKSAQATKQTEASPTNAPTMTWLAPTPSAAESDGSAKLDQRIQPNPLFQSKPFGSTPSLQTAQPLASVQPMTENFAQIAQPQPVLESRKQTRNLFENLDSSHTSGKEPNPFYGPGLLPYSAIEHLVLPGMTGVARLHFLAAIRIRSLNRGFFSKASARESDSRPLGPLMKKYLKVQNAIYDAMREEVRELKRKNGEFIREDDPPSKRSKNSGDVHSTRTKPNQEANSSSRALVPMSDSTSRQNVSQANNDSRKRKPEFQITDRDPEGENGRRKIKTSSTEHAPASETSKAFKTILDQPAQPISSPSPRKILPPRAKSPASTANSEEPAKASPFSNILGSKSGNTAQASSTITGSSSNIFGGFKPTPSPVPSQSGTGNTPSSQPQDNMTTTAAAPSSPFKPTPALSATNKPIFFGAKPATTPAISSPLAKPPSFAEESPKAAAPVLSASFTPSFNMNAATSTTDAGNTSSAAAHHFGSASTPTPSKGGFTPTSGGLKPPTFGAPVNFLAQFGESAAATEKKKMQAAKDEDFDSDEETEEEWEAKYKAKRAVTLKQLEESAKTSVRFSLTPTSSAAPSERGSSAPPKSPSKSPPSLPFAQTSTPSNSFFPTIDRSGTSSPASVFDGMATKPPVTFSGFGHLYKTADETDEAGDDDSDDEGAEMSSSRKRPLARIGLRSPTNVFGSQTSSNSESGSATPSLFDRIAKDENGNPLQQLPEDEPTPKSSSLSLFDRIAKDENGNPIRNIPTEEKKDAAPTSTLFGNMSSSTSNMFNLSKPIGGDQTWTPNSPIKFGSSTPTPSFGFGSKPSTPSIFQQKGPTESGSQIFGATASPPSVNVEAPSPVKPPAPALGLFGNSGSSFGNAPSTGLFSGVQFGSTLTSKPSSGAFSGLSSTPASGVTSGATSTADRSEAESDADTNDGGEHTNSKQIDLVSSGAGEEREDVVYQVRARCSLYVPQHDREEGGLEWAVKGVGELRILKHKETGASRVVVRADPSGAIIINKRILPGKYEAAKKTVKLITAGDTEKEFQRWILQVKTEESAKELAQALAENKMKAS